MRIGRPSPLVNPRARVSGPLSGTHHTPVTLERLRKTLEL
jgi:hypothetical protein